MLVIKFKFDEYGESWLQIESWKQSQLEVVTESGKVRSISKHVVRHNVNYVR